METQKVLNSLAINQMAKKKQSTTKHSVTTRGSIFVAVLAITLSGCVITPEEENEKPQNTEEEPPEGQADEPGFIATSYTTSTHIGVNLEIKIRPLELINNDTLKLSMEVTNSSNENYILEDALGDTENLHSASNATLIDPISQTRHLNNELGDGSCYCTFADEAIASGESIDLEVMFPAPPEGTETMTVTTPVTSPFLDIPITESSGSIDEESVEGEIIPLTMISDDGDGTGRSEQESEEELSILLSSDVLFDFESAELTPDADEIIEQVASEIDQSSSDVVTIEGHTDDQGTDSVNIPLSEERAESVESALTDLVSRDNVTFETEGHGSSDPVADNETEEGQELNRRVTVTFAK